MSTNNKRLYAYIAVTLFCGLFSFIYELFSHGVYSNFMVYLFAIPLFLGVVPELVALTNPSIAARGSWQPTLQAFAVATLAVGSTLQGIVEIYGTTNQYILYYFIIGITLLAASVMTWTVQLLQQQRA